MLRRLVCARAWGRRWRSSVGGEGGPWRCPGVLVRESGEDAKVEVGEVSVSAPAPGEVLVRVEAASVNWLDRMAVEGRLAPDSAKKKKEGQEEEATPLTQPRAPFVPGFELCGEVTRVGAGVCALAPGDRVLALALGGVGGRAWGGAWAQLCNVHAGDAWRVPASLDAQTAAALGYSYASALLALGQRSGGRVREGCTLLVTGASGGLGLAALDVAANVYRAKVVALCRSEERASFARDRGAWAALTYDAEHMRRRVREVTGGRGVDVVLDTVGGDVFSAALSCAGQDAVVLSAGWASGKAPKVSAADLLPRSLALVASSLEHWRLFRPEEYRSLVQDAIQLHQDGLLKPAVWRTASLRHAAQALKDMRERKPLGKTLLLPQLKEED